MKESIHLPDLIKSMIIYAVCLIIFSFAIFGIGKGLDVLLNVSILSEHFYKIIILLTLITFFSHIISIIGIQGKAEMGVFGILGAILLKMILSLSFFILLLLRYPEMNKMVFGLNFFCAYLLMSSFEIIVLLRNLRRKLN